MNEKAVGDTDDDDEDDDGEVEEDVEKVLPGDTVDTSSESKLKRRRLDPWYSYGKQVQCSIVH